ncbi:hypothetical protein [Nonomuraea dietziae]|uniref:hypothetical protein n=1 Tax=Nonomuraea dietziae TaxID=65515 RepID=UPI003444EC00
MADLGLGDAWELWLQGAPISQHTLYGCPMVTVGRLGKVASFMGALTVLLDLVGVEKLKAMSEAAQRWLDQHDSNVAENRLPPGKGIYVLTFLISLVFIFFLARTFDEWTSAIPLYPAIAVFSYLPALTLRILWLLLLGGRIPAHPLRWIGFVLFVVGFHFDLLAS